MMCCCRVVTWSWKVVFWDEMKRQTAEWAVILV
jgi:hypothetical protein